MRTTCYRRTTKTWLILPAVLALSLAQAQTTSFNWIVDNGGFAVTTNSLRETAKGADYSASAHATLQKDVLSFQVDFTNPPEGTRGEHQMSFWITDDKPLTNACGYKVDLYWDSANWGAPTDYMSLFRVDNGTNTAIVSGSTTAILRDSAKHQIKLNVYNGKVWVELDSVTMATTNDNSYSKLTRVAINSYMKYYSVDALYENILVSGAADFGLLAYYPFDGTAQDASGNGNHATLHNTASYVAGTNNQAIHLQGRGHTGTDGDYVTFPGLALDTRPAFTIALWVKHDGYSGMADHGESYIAFGRQYVTTANIGFWGTPWSFHYSGSNNGVSTVSDGSEWGNWVHHTLVFSSGVLLAYKNGALVGSTNGVTIGSVTQGGLGISWFNSGGTESTRFIGSMDDVRIYNRAFSSNEVLSLSSIQGLNPPTNLSATDGTLANRISVTWSIASTATSYLIWRAYTNSAASATLLTNVTAAAYDDTDVTACVTNWYWVQAIGVTSTSGLSQADSGWAAQGMRLVIDGNPAKIGAPVPDGYGTNTVIQGRFITNSVAAIFSASNGVRFVCTGYTGSGSVPNGVSNGVMFVADLDSELTWLWRREYQLVVSNAVGGSVSASGWYATNAYSLVTATPSNGWMFLQWQGNVPAGAVTNNPLSLAMDTPRTLSPVFLSLLQDSDSDGMPDWWEMKYGLNPNSPAPWGRGGDGDLTVAVGQTNFVDSVKSNVTGRNPAGTNLVNVASTNGFKVADAVLVITIQDPRTDTNVNIAGQYEFNRVAGTATGALIFESVLSNSFDAGSGQKIQVMRVPEYRNLTVSGTATCASWDGSMGGVLAFRAKTLTVASNGVITTSGKGFRGGADYAQANAIGFQGESYCGAYNNRSTVANHSGGGGGSYDGGLSGSGGGGGGNGSVGENGYNPNSGVGGNLVGFSSMLRIYLGGAGGSGGQDGNDTAYDSLWGDGKGGNGGGIILIQAKNISNEAWVASDGKNGYNGTNGTERGGGGGGSGGNVYLFVERYAGSGRVQAIGGQGGLGSAHASGTQDVNKGGTGGVGRVRFDLADTNSVPQSTPASGYVGSYDKLFDGRSDLDDDSLTALQEYVAGTDPTKRDTDGDGMSDEWEVKYGLNPLINDADGDLDGDGLCNSDEFKLGTKSNVCDSDSDGLNDGDEVHACGTDPLKKDTDGDGMEDGWEVGHGFAPLVDESSGDRDLDGIMNGEEVRLGLDPARACSFGDGTNDYRRVYGKEYVCYTYDRIDRLLGTEYSRGSNGLSIAYGYDGNGNILRQIYLQRDQDNDGLPDLWEFMNGLSVTNAADHGYMTGDADGDGWTNYQEWKAGANPLSGTSVPDVVGMTGVTSTVFEAAFRPDRFVMGVGQLDGVGAEEVVIGADGNPNDTTNSIRILTQTVDGWAKEDVPIGPFGITSVGIAQPTNTLQAAIYLGLRNFGDAGVVMRVVRESNSWSKSLIAFDSNAPSNQLVNAGFEYGVDGTTNMAGAIPLGWSGVFSNLVRTAADKRSGSICLGVTNAGVRVFTESAWQWVDTRAMRVGADLTLNGNVKTAGSITNGLVSYFRLDETLGTSAVDSFGGKNGNNSNVMLGQTGKLGSSYFFNGSSSEVSMGTQIALNNRSFSISIWMANTRGEGANSMVVGLHSSGAMRDSLHVGRRGSNGKFTFAFFDDDLDSNAPVAINGTWQHWVVTYDQETNRRRIYLNGIIDASNTAGGPLIATGNFILGRQEWNTTTWFGGKLDEVGIWHRALEPEEVLALYNGSIGARPEDLTHPDIVNKSSRLAIEWWDTTNGLKQTEVSGVIITNTGGSWVPFTVTAQRTRPDFNWAKCLVEVSCRQSVGVTAGVYIDDMELQGDLSGPVENVAFVQNNRESPSDLLVRMFRGCSPDQALYRMGLQTNGWQTVMINTNSSGRGPGMLYVQPGGSNSLRMVSSLDSGQTLVLEPGPTSAVESVTLSGIASNTIPWLGGEVAIGAMRPMTNGVSVVVVRQNGSDGVMPTNFVVREFVVAGTSAVLRTEAGFSVSDGCESAAFGVAASDYLNSGSDVLFTGEPDGRVFSWTTASTNTPLVRVLFSGRYQGKTWHQLQAYGGVESGEWLLGLSVDPTNASTCNLIAWAPQSELWTPPDIPQTAPRVTLLASPSSGVERAIVRVRVADSEGNPTVPELHYQKPGESVWQRATVVQADGVPFSGPMPTMGSAVTGMVHTLEWDCRADLGDRFVSTVLLRVRGRDVTLTGAWSEPVSYFVTVLPWYTVTVEAGANGSVQPGSAFLVMEGASTSLVARADVGYHVSGVWLDGIVTNAAGLGSAQATLTINNVAGDHQVRFEFALDRHTFTVESQHGTPDPAAGVHTFDLGTQVTNRVDLMLQDGGVRYDCAGWRMAGCEPVGGPSNQVVVVLTNSATLTWLWTTNYAMSFAASGPGTLSLTSGWYRAGQTLTLTAYPEEETVLAGWTGDTAGCTEVGNSLFVPADQPRNITATFSRDMRLLVVESRHGMADPAEGQHPYPWSTAVTCAITNPVVLDAQGTARYTCTGWVGTGIATNGVGTNTHFVLTVPTTVVWQWQTNYWLEAVVEGVGNVGATNAWYGDGETALLIATAGNNYHFKGWLGDTNGCVIAGTALIAPMGSARRVTAVFSGDLHSLSVFSEQRGCLPAVGMYSVPYGQDMTCSVTNSPFVTGGHTQLVCTGWSGMGSVPAAGVTTNTGTFTLTGDSAIFWLWRREYLLTAQPEGQGTLSMSSAWVEEGSVVTILATPQPYHTLFGWSGDIAGCLVNGTELMAVMSRPRDIQAVFVETRAPKGTPEGWLAAHGLTNSASAVAELEDADHDGFAAWQEYLADTDPTNRLSRLELTGLRLVAGGTEVGWKGGVQANQWLEAKYNLGNTGEQWVAIFTNLPPTSTSTNVTDTGATNAMRFYRIRATR